jgi:hypothetical protein
MNGMTGFQIYLKTSTVVGGILGGAHGHFYRTDRMKDLASPTSIVALGRDIFVGACFYPILLPVHIVSPFIPGLVDRLKQCPFSGKSNQEN